MVTWGTLVPLALLVVGGFVVIAAWGRNRTRTMATSTNRLLFALVIMLFALLFKLVLTGKDVVALIIGIMGVAVGWYGLSVEPHQSQLPHEPQQP